MDTNEFVGKVTRVKLSLIKPSSHNPRGQVSHDNSFARLIDSIAQVGVLVPIVVMKLSEPSNGKKYELVDGERRYWAALELGFKYLPAHVLSPQTWTSNLRSLMFHLHMTREQWGPLAQCRSLTEAFPDLATGIPFSEKEKWAKQIAKETGMQQVTARDRVHILAWPQHLKEKIYEYDELHPKDNVYSYVLALEASIVEPSRKVFLDYYEKSLEDSANLVRSVLLDKVTNGLQRGSITSREQIRDVSPLFSPNLDSSYKRAAKTLFKELVSKPDAQFDDIKAEMQARLPELSSETAPRPQRLIARVRALEKTISLYEPSFVQNSARRASTERRLRHELEKALQELESASVKLRTDLHDQ